MTRITDAQVETALNAFNDYTGPPYKWHPDEMKYMRAALEVAMAMGAKVNNGKIGIMGRERVIYQYMTGRMATVKVIYTGEEITEEVIDTISDLIAMKRAELRKIHNAKAGDEEYSSWFPP